MMVNFEEWLESKDPYMLASVQMQKDIKAKGVEQALEIMRQRIEKTSGDDFRKLRGIVKYLKSAMVGDILRPYKDKVLELIKMATDKVNKAKILAWGD